MRHENSTFTDTVVKLDGNEFVNCTLTRCTLIFSGNDTVKFIGSRFSGCKWQFDGPAGRTIDLLSQMYQDPTFRPLVDKTLEGIRKGAVKDLLVN